jgi:hypothetical protein
MPSIVYLEMQKILNWLHQDLPDPSMTHNRLVEEHHEGMAGGVVSPFEDVYDMERDSRRNALG